MVVADEDPPRKRSRLSLKSKKGDSAAATEEMDAPPLETAGMTPQGPQIKSEEEATDCSPSLIDLTESDLPSEGPGAPPVASMENLGNTCFLNSVLEVLRYTPCFLEGLEELYRHIVYLEKLKALDIVQGSDEVKTDPSLAWDLVKNMFKMYKKMEKREEMFGQFANADVTSMAVKPDKVLDVIREFNPMFEGHMQHDAQEVLRCLLCYLEDSERELHSDYASILALDPALLKTPGPGTHCSSGSRTASATVTSASLQEAERSGCNKPVMCNNPVMEKFLAAGQSNLRRGGRFIRAVSALKFEQSSPETQPSESEESNNNRVSNSNNDDDGDNSWRVEHELACFRCSSPSFSKTPQTVEMLVGDCKVKTVSPETQSETRKRRFCYSRLRQVSETEEFDEVDCVVKKEWKKTAGDTLAKKVDPSVSTDHLPSHSDYSKDEQQVPNCGPFVRRSARQRVNNKRLADCGAKKKAGRGKRTCTNMAKEEWSDCTSSRCSEVLNKSENFADRSSAERRTMVNGDDDYNQHYPAEGLDHVDKSQPTILSMLSKQGRVGGRGQCRRLGMRGRVVHHPHPNPAVLSPLLLPESTLDQSPELRRSPRKPASTRPVAITMSPQKQNGVMTPSASPARPDEFPSHAVSRSSGAGLDLDPTLLGGGADNCDTSPVLNRTPVWARLWDIADIVSTIPFSQGSEFSKAAATSSDHEPVEDTDSTEMDDQPFIHPVSLSDDDGLDSVHLKQEGVTSPVKSCLEKMLASRKGMLSPGLSFPSCGGLLMKEQGLNSPPASKLMIKLEKCDYLCNTPTISATAALKALKVTVDPRRKMVFDDNDYCENNDSDEDEVSLGTKSSFKSVPLKSVSVKVEKCDMVCDSPEKWVSARLATSTLARQRAQRFNIIEKLFQGTMVNRTKCLECERCTERKESFQDISVPLTAEGSTNSDSENDEKKDSSLLRLMHAFTDVEHLRDDNKYYCEQCYRYVEAERSLHYESLPNILTVHLKRFSATGMFGCLSKINDYVTVPLLLSCLRYKCPKPCVRPDHRYTLYAIITHAGSTISAGHYLAYIKVRPNALGHETLSTYLNTPAKQHSTPDNLFNSPSTPQHDTDMTTTSLAQTLVSPHNTVTEKGDKSEDWNMGMNGMQTPPRGEGREGEERGQSERDSPPADYHWLECDDETIRILTEKEFHGRLLEKDGALRGTPYVLFYHRLDAWNAK